MSKIFINKGKKLKNLLLGGFLCKMLICTGYSPGTDPLSGIQVDTTGGVSTDTYFTFDAGNTGAINEVFDATHGVYYSAGAYEEVAGGGYYDVYASLTTYQFIGKIHVPTTATQGAIENAVDGGSGTEVTEGSDFRFAHSPQQIMIGMGTMSGAFSGSGSPTYAKTMASLEKILSASKLIKQVSQNVALWASGIYGQGELKSMYDNPVQNEKHYGVMVGTHYYDKQTEQVLGVAFNLGFGGSFAKVDHELKSNWQINQGTVYYGFGFAQGWRFDTQGSFIRISGTHNRPYLTNGGGRDIAMSQSLSQVMTGMVALSYKYKPSSAFHLKPSITGTYAHTKQFAFQEKGAGANSLSYAPTKMNEVSVRFGVKASFFHEANENKTYGLYPTVSYTRYVKSGKINQSIVNLNSGQTQFLQSGTAGKDLFSVGVGAGITDKQASTKVQVGYTANFQKYRNSHELMIKASVDF